MKMSKEQMMNKDEDERMMRELLSTCKYQHELLIELVTMIDEHIAPNIKDGVDPFDVIGEMCASQRMAINLNQHGSAMRHSMIETMLRSEASMPKGMSLTSKVAGGSPTASVKREYSIKKGVSKVKTYYTFRKLVQAVRIMLANDIELHELYEYSDNHHWDETSDDGTYCYDGHDCKCAEAVDKFVDCMNALIPPEYRDNGDEQE